ncbi:putative porin [Acinetobacter calcoaceticus]|uniref:Putative porin n=1 Tax=Acinetobacter calcoaceticus TaxID=471 RepID=A0A4R1XEH3_ACICA|nr:putative porin [Acinetobacter calcoaceticus]
MHPKHMHPSKPVLSLCVMTCALLIAPIGHTEIDLIAKNQLDSPLLSPLSVQFGGQLRPQWVHNVGDEPSYYKNGHDGLSRLRLTINYDVSPETKVVGYYERGINPFKILGMDNHYSPQSPSSSERQSYISIENKTYGTLTYGHQFGLYYSVIGMKSDVWDNDAHAGATAIGAHTNYDGANRPKNSLMYSKDFDHFKLYANVLFPEKAKVLSDQHIYKRQNGAGIGLDYKPSKTLTYSAAFSTTKAQIKSEQHQATTEANDYQQNIFGTAVTYQPNQWYLVATASYYNDFVPVVNNPTVQHYFVGDGYGLEAFAGYTFKFDLPYLKSIQPYIAVDSLRLKSAENFRANHQYVGFSTSFNKNLKIMTEHTFASTSDKSEKDSTWITMFISF